MMKMSWPCKVSGFVFHPPKFRSDSLAVFAEGATTYSILESETCLPKTSIIFVFVYTISKETMSNVHGLRDDSEDEEDHENDRYVGGIGERGGGR